MNIKLSNGKEIPKVGFGVYKLENNDASKDLILKAFEAGYRHFDTASFYGNEEVVGNAIKSSGLKREEIFITTKIWNDDQRNDNVKGALELSLEKLGIDYIDLYLTHWPVKDKFIKTYCELEKYRDSGLIKSLGVSNMKIHHIESLKKECNIMPVVNQIEVNPYFSNEEVVDYCNENNIVVEAFSPLCANKNNVLLEPILVELAEKYKKSPAQIIINWLMQRGIVPLAKTATPSRMKENFDVFDFKLSNEDVKRVNSINKNTRSAADPDNFDF